ncbi:hypothetical protein [Pontibacter vulgaris]|uniref:hypothetical protein n=1 Tax=Pontibacter vulgaris TaxID=2905679 RepID=UPI001FA73B38|nr:hypothetical protein [Pontibacter vulgaris]
MDQLKDTQNWPELAAALYDKLTGKNAEITYEFENLELDVPSSTASDAPQAKWKLNGKVRIRTQNNEQEQNKQ